MSWRQLLGPLLLLGLYGFIFHLFMIYDWEHPLVKVGCFAGLFALVLRVFLNRDGGPDREKVSLGVEVALVSALLGLVVVNGLDEYAAQLLEPPRIDIGRTTQRAAELFFSELENPYADNTIARLNDNPEQWGFKYGPLMFLGYGFSAVFPQSGLKLSSAVFLLITLVMIGLLVWNEQKRRLENIGAVVFAVTLVVLPRRVWHELARQGVVDVLPTMLIVVSLVFVKRAHPLLAGMAAGLSFSTKFSPALFFIVACFRKQTPRRFYWGIALGLVPMVIFAGWDFDAFWNNVFLFHMTKQHDSTSLYSVVPEAFHFLFPLLQLVAMLAVVRINFARPPHFMQQAVSTIVLLICIETLYREMHANHLLWFVPLLAVVLARYRDRLVPATLLGAPSGSDFLASPE